MKPIGYVRRESKEEDIRDRSLILKIVVRRDLVNALDGLEGFSHLYVVFYLHEVAGEETRTLKAHPRGRTDLPLLGVLTTRIAHRPNPIGLTLVELVERRNNVLFVKGLDAFDGTPVLDIKPADSWDMTTNLRVPEWREKLDREELSHQSATSKD